MNRNKISNRLRAMQIAAFLLSAFIAAPAWAGTITEVSLQDSKKGDVVTIESDGPLEYQVFNLDGPPRLVMTFPNSTLDNSVVAIKGVGAGVTNLFPLKNELGVRIEVGMSEELSYEIEEKSDKLVVRFASAEADADMPTDKAVVKNISVKDRGDMTEVTLVGVNMDASHNSFMTNQNKSLVLDFWGGKSRVGKEYVDYASQRVKGITIGEADDRLRLVVDLVQTAKMEQQIDASKDKLVIRFGKVSGATSGVAKVEGVDFQPDGRISRVMVRTDVTTPVILVHEEKDKTVIDVKGALLEQGQERTQDLRAFAGPIEQIDTYRMNDKVRIVVHTREEIEVQSFQQGNIFTLNFVPQDVIMASRGKEKAEGKFSYSGERVTFDFKDIEIMNALKLIAEMSDLNIIMSDDVSGTLTMRLVDVPWDQALDLILSAKGLGKEQTGNVLRVAPVEVLRAEYASKIEARKGSLQLEPLITEFVTLSYTKVDAVKKMLESAAAAGKDNKKNTKEGEMPEAANSGLLSSRGSILTDERTNTLIIKDTQTAINNVKRLIAVIDKPIQQVLIEARIVEASDSFTHSIGVRWGGSSNRQTGYDFPGAVAVGAAGTTVGNAEAIISGGISTATGRGMLVDLPAATGPGAGGAIGLSLGSFTNAINLDLELSAAQADGEAKIISNPRIVTSNLKSATVTQGSLVPIVTPGSANSPATTTLTKAALSLDVTPQITADNGVILDIVVTKDSPIVFNGATGIDSKAVTTNVYVKNGETIVIGGVYTRDKAENVSSVPGLSEIPFLGWLFKNKQIRDNKTELLIFITPKIMQGAVAS